MLTAPVTLSTMAVEETGLGRVDDEGAKAGPARGEVAPALEGNVPVEGHGPDDLLAHGCDVRLRELQVDVHGVGIELLQHLQELDGIVVSALGRQVLRHIRDGLLTDENLRRTLADIITTLGGARWKLRVQSDGTVTDAGSADATTPEQSRDIAEAGTAGDTAS